MSVEKYPEVTVLDVMRSDRHERGMSTIAKVLTDEKFEVFLQNPMQKNTMERILNGLDSCPTSLNEYGVNYFFYKDGNILYGLKCFAPKNDKEGAVGKEWKRVEAHTSEFWNKEDRIVLVQTDAQ